MAYSESFMQVTQGQQQQEKKVCAKCFIPQDFPAVSFSSSGLCSRCEHFEQADVRKVLNEELNLNRLDELKVIAEKIKKEAAQKHLKYDCIIGASGGFDSTYVIYVAKKILGLNPLVVKYDNGLCHPQANKNLIKACEILGVELKIHSVTKYERMYILNSTKALLNLGVFFSACFSCHYIIQSVVFREAKEHNLKYMLTCTNHVEKNLAMSSHGFMLKSLIKGFFRCNPWKMLKVIYYEIIANYYFVKLKFQYDGLSLRFFRNLFRLHPATPSFIQKISISDYMAWNWPVIEKTLREQLQWDTPRRTKVPYFRFDCHFSSLIDKSFKRVTGVSEHALLVNWFVQAGFISKKEIEDDFNYMNDDSRIDKEIKIALEKLGLPEKQV